MIKVMENWYRKPLGETKQRTFEEKVFLFDPENHTNNKSFFVLTEGSAVWVFSRN